ncbi:MAG: hypothetical protein ACXV7J_09590 [Methylomonas sp.]
MKTRIATAITLALVVTSAGAEVYKCNKSGKSVYQSKPCDLDAPDKNKLHVKVQTPEEEAAAKAKLQEIEASNTERKEKAAEKAFENSVMRGAANAMSRDATVSPPQPIQPRRDVNNPAMGVVPAYGPVR